MRLSRTTPIVFALALGSIGSIGCDEEKKPAPPAASASGSAAAMAPSASASAAPAPKPTMPEMLVASNKLVLDGWNSHDTKKLASAYAADGVLKIPGMPDVKGRESIGTEAQQNFNAWPDFKVGFSRVWQKGNVQVIEWVVTGTNTGEFMGKKATGRPTGVAGVSVVTLNEDGLIKEDRRYFDMMTTNSQLDPKAAAGSFRAVATLPATVEVHVAKDDAPTLAKANEMYTTIDAHKIDPIIALFADDAAYDDFGQPAAMKGKKGMKDMIGGYMAAFPDLKQTNSMQFVADGWVISEGVLTGTHKGALGPFKASNKPVTIHYVDFWQIKDGHVVSARTYSNGLEVMIQIGAVPAPGMAPAASASGTPAPSSQPAPKASVK